MRAAASVRLRTSCGAAASFIATRRLPVVLVAGVAMGAAIALFTAPRSPSLPGYAQVRAGFEVSDTRLLDRHGEVIHELRVDDTRRRLPWTELDDIAPTVTAAVILAEDRRFRQHHGVDWRALAVGAWQSLAGRPRGASTISMQLAGMLDPASGSRSGSRTSWQKWRQVVAARTLERHWSKEQILEAYLNLVSFRGELEGIGSASRGLFDKAPSGLSEPEATLLAVLLRGPNASSATVAQRACVLRAGLRSQTSQNDCDDLQALAAAALDRVPRVRQAAVLAPHVARRLLGNGSATVRSTLDADAQRFALAVVQEQLHLLARENVRDAAVLAVDNVTGEVIVYLGNSGTNPAGIHVDGVRAQRQPGSALKPFLYGLALERRWLTAASLLDDSPLNLVAPGGEYLPQNYDRTHRGWVSVRTALAGSLNIPAVRTLMLVGVDAFIDRLRDLGFDGVDRSGEYYGYALALGSAEVTLWQLVNAYRSLANGGLHGPLTLSPGQSDPSLRRVSEEGAAWIVGDMLSDRGARGITFGFANPLGLSMAAAVKTGTSKDMRDNWAVGYSGRYTVGVWVGNFDGEPMRDVSGVSGAAPVWAALMEYLHAGEHRPDPLPHPEVVTRATVHFEPTIEAPRREYFLQGTEIERVVLRSAATEAPRITYPNDGTILAVDPDIPEDMQRVFFAATPGNGAWQWRLNGEMQASAVRGWQPQRGEHELALLNESGEVLQRVRFSVR